MASAATSGAVGDGVDAEQRLGQAEAVHDRARRRPGAEDLQLAGAHLGDRVHGDVVEHALLAGDAAGLGRLHEAAREGHGHVAVEVGRDAVLAKGLLVDVHDLGLAQVDRRGAVVKEEGDEVAGGRRGGRVHGGVDLDPRRDTDHRDAAADRVVDVARRAVAAGEEDHVDAGGLERARRLLGVGRRREHEVVAGDARALDARRCARARTRRRSGGRRASRRPSARSPAARASSSPISPGPVTTSISSLRRARRSRASWARRGASARRAQLERLAQDLGPVAALEAHAAADPGHRD